MDGIDQIDGAVPLGKGNRLRRKRAQRPAAQEPAASAAVKFTGNPNPVYFDGLATDMPVAIDMRDGQPDHLDLNLRHAPIAGGRSVHADMIYIGGRGPDFRRCKCGLKGVRRNRACPKCGLTLQDSATLSSYKEEAMADKLAPSVMHDRKIEIRNITPDADGVIRNKHFRNCGIIGPAILFLMQDVYFTGGVFDVADNSIESIIWPPNPAATRAVGIIGVDHCRFEGGRFTNIGFTGGPEVLNALRRIGAMEHKL